MPLTFDFPLERLATYQGINPRPTDFDAYWAAGLAEMRAVDPQIELVPADFHAPGVDCRLLYFTGVGGARVHAKLLRLQRAGKWKDVFFALLPEEKSSVRASVKAEAEGAVLV